VDEQQQQAPEASPAPEKTLTQSEVNAILARETRKLRATFEPAVAEAESLKARLAEIEADRARAEEEKLTAQQRQDRKIAAERDGYQKQIADLSARAQDELKRRHGLMVQHAAASRIGSVATRLFNPEIAPEIESLVSSAMAVEAVDGREVVTIRVGEDVEPIETGWQRFVDTKLNKFFKAAGGAGAAHGGGGSAGGRSAFAGMSPTEKIAASLKGR
jgi:nanoRNase/pAp phosphatase (c-di-AMP/oligoRNAs hydrolase)